MSSKESIRIGLQTGKYVIFEKPQSDASWWKNFGRIKDSDGQIVNYVQCVRCKILLAYEPKTTGSSTLKNHDSSCKITHSASTITIEKMLIKKTNVPLNLKRLIVDACAKMCCYDLRPYEMVTGKGFELLCETLIDVGRLLTSPLDISSLIPDPTTVSRRVQALAEGMKDMFQQHIMTSLFRIEKETHQHSSRALEVRENDRRYH